MESTIVPSQSKRYASNEPSGNSSFIRVFCTLLFYVRWPQFTRSGSLVIVVRSSLRGGYRKGQDARRLDGNHAVLILQSSIHTQKFGAVDRQPALFVKVRLYDDVGDSRFIFKAEEYKSFGGSRALPRNHASCDFCILPV